MALGEGVGVGVGDGDGEGDGDGDGISEGDGSGVAPGEGEGVLLGDGEGISLGDGDGVALGDGDGEPLGAGFATVSWAVVGATRSVAGTVISRRVVEINVVASACSRLGSPAPSFQMTVAPGRKSLPVSVSVSGPPPAPATAGASVSCCGTAVSSKKTGMTWRGPEIVSEEDIIGSAASPLIVQPAKL